MINNRQLTINIAMRTKTLFYSILISTLFFLSTSISTFAQGTPRLNSLFPAGGQIGTTLEIAIQGSDLEGARTLIVEGDPGITAQLHPGGDSVTNSDHRITGQ